MTTSSMEEADAVSDRIAIMKQGRMRCCGSPAFLKSTFGSGYRLTVYKQQQAIDNSGDELRVAEAFKATQFRAFLLNTLSNGKMYIESDVGAEMLVVIPFECAPRMAKLLSEMETRKAYYGIISYAVASASIEEVFLKYEHILVAFFFFFFKIATN